MARRPARLPVAFLLVLGVTLLALAAPALGAGWGNPFQFQKPGTLDALAPQLAFAGLHCDHGGWIVRIRNWNIVDGEVFGGLAEAGAIVRSISIMIDQHSSDHGF